MASSEANDVVPAPSALIEPPPYKPGQREIDGYYRGLPSCPPLVARSSGQSWHGWLPGHTFPRTKKLDIVGKHPIVDAWDADFQAEIIEALGTTRFTSIDIVRIGYSGMGEKNVPLPVVLWIGVRPGSLTWDDGMTIVKACVAILRRHKLIDIHCEIRESEFHASARPSPTYWPHESPPPAMTGHHLPFTASPGESINPLGSSIHGTLGLYLRPGESNPHRDSVWAVSCRHVVLPEKDGRVAYQYKKTGQPRIEILLPSDEAIEKSTMHANENLGGRALRLGLAEKALTLSTPEQAQKLEEARIHLRQCRDLVDKELPRWQSTADRTVGYVRIAPPLQTAQSMNPPSELFGPRRDWALIEVDKDKHPGPVSNIVDVETGLAPGSLDYNVMLFRHYRTYSPRPPMGELFNEKLLRLGRSVPMDELRTPNMLDPQEDPCLIVAKRGPRSGVTWGYVNGLKSVVWDDGDSKSMECCVVPTSVRNAFCFKGDSGSPVFDVTGRVVGIIAGGAEGPLGRESMDITYVTPMAWLQQDMKDWGFSVEIA